MARRKLIAAIDVGSNALTMKIAQAGQDGKPQVIDTVRGNLALGIDTYNNQVISLESLTILIEHLDGFKEKLREYKVSEYRIVATSAFREAENRDYLLSQVRHATGMEVEILSNSEERYYHHNSLTEVFPEFAEIIQQGTILLDMGAGSIQISTYDKDNAVFSENLRLGYLRISELFSELQVRSTDFPRIMDEYIGGELTSVLRLEPKGMIYKNIIATGTELYYLGQLAGQDTRKDPYLRAKDFETVFNRLMNTQSIALTTELGIPADVAELLLPAALILNKYFNHDQMKGVYLPFTSLCDGILTDMAEDAYRYKGTYDHRNDLISTAKQMAIRYRSDMAHTEQVERIALAIYKAIRRRFKMPSRDRFLLRLITILHDIGIFVDTSNFDVHTSHIILVSELIGLTWREQETIAFACSFGVGNDLTIPTYLRLRSQSFREHVLQLAGILRLAIALDASRTQKITDMEAKLRGPTLQITVQGTENFELEDWALSRSKQLFCDLFGLEISIRHVNPLL